MRLLLRSLEEDDSKGMLAGDPHQDLLAKLMHALVYQAFFLFLFQVQELADDHQKVILVGALVSRIHLCNG